MVPIIEWTVLSSAILVITSIATPLIIYIRTWTKFDVTVSNLAEVVDKLSAVITDLQQEQAKLYTRVSKLEAKVDIYLKWFEVKTKMEDK